MKAWVTGTVGLAAGLVVGWVLPRDGAASRPRVEIEDGGTHRVVRVVDGDTIDLENGLRLRYMAVDTPEMGVWRDDRQPQPFAVEATEANRLLVEEKLVRIQLGPRTFDPYGRLLARVFVEAPDGGELDVGMKLLEEGLGHAVGPDLNDVNYHEALRAEAAAQAAGRGLWASDQSAQGAGQPAQGADTAERPEE